MEENTPSTILEGKITGISFSLATRQEICLSSISDCPVSHASQLTNPFLGLPLEVGKCESCGTAEPGKCEGHFGYIELPIPIYHPSHIGELKRILSLICLKCLKFKNRRLQSKNAGMLDRAFALCCEEAAQVTVNENQKKDGLELKYPSRTRPIEGFWDFLDRYGYRYGHGNTRPLLPSEVLKILKKIPEATKKKLAARGCFVQEGYIMQHLPVPPNCLSTPDVSDGISVSSSDISMPMLKKVLRQVEIIKSSRSGNPNFESLEFEVTDLQLAVDQYLQSRGAKASPDRNTRYAIAKTQTDSSSTKAWLEKMKTLFISKGSGFSSRSVITGDPYKGVAEIGIPYEIAHRITFEERVTEQNMKFLQKLVDDKLCLTYRDGQSTYSLREGSKGHTFLKPGQIVHRKIMEGDVIFINRPPTTHKHALQALSVYIHDDHTFKINPIICGPLAADFDGDCIHIFYPQSPEAKAEVLELFAVEKQLLSSHNGNVNLQLGTDSMLSLKTLFRKYFFSKAEVQQLALFASSSLPKPSLLKVCNCGPLWTVLELLESYLPRGFSCSGDRFLIKDSKILKLDYGRDVMQSIMNEVISSIFFSKGPKEVLKLFDSLQPMLMENLCAEGFNISLEDFVVPEDVLKTTESKLQELSSLLYHLRSNYNEVIALQLDRHLRAAKSPISDFILRFSSMGNLIDSKSDSAITRVVQQIGFLGLQILETGRLYSRTLAEDLSSHFIGNYPFAERYPYEEFGLIRSCLFYGLDPYQEMVHSVANREVMVRSSRGLTEPGILFKNSMAILRDVVICYDGTVRNVCSNSIIQFEYGAMTQNIFAAGEPVGVLAATAMSNPAYKAVLDSSPNSNSSWNMMKEILQCGVNFKNSPNDRRVVLYLNDCDCGGKHCLEHAAFAVKNHLSKVSLKDVALEFLIEYKRQPVTYESAEMDGGLVGHVHLNKKLLEESHINMEDVLTKCQDTLNSFRKKKKVGQLFKKIEISCSECSFQQSSSSNWTPCLKFFCQDTTVIQLEKTAHIFADDICPIFLNSIIKGDPRVKEANITWITPETTVWIKNSSRDQKGELAIDVVLEKEAVKKNGDAWRTVMDSCLPVIHLIDTTRSIPYAIKQVEDLLGIACAFEQAVQRLSTSVSMVTKGMLKEHLLLLASSMTCAGFLVGFNLAGIKALNKALNFQVPFSEATVYTPKRCFERAAEKCHADALSSIVAACSWGKPVSVGTGSRFDILWDTREVELNQKEGIDVYSFLHLVCGGSEETDSGCLGGDVDNFELEDNYMEAGSPEHDPGSAKPVFEDGLDLVDGLDAGPTWTTGPTQDDMASTGGWGNFVKTPAAGSGWGAAKSDSVPALDDGLSSGGWGSSVKTPATGGGWGAAKSDQDPAPEDGTGGGWGVSVKTLGTGGGWGAAKSNQDPAPEDGTSGGWGGSVKTTPAIGGGWGTTKSNQDPAPEDGNSGGWGGSVKTTPATGGSWGATKSQKEVEPSGWGAKTTENESGKDSGSWGQKVLKPDEPGWGGTKSTAGEASGSWGQQVAATNDSGWGKKNENEAEKGSGSWGQKTVKPDGPGWGAKRNGNELQQASGSWGQQMPKANETAWGRRKNDDTEKGLKGDAHRWNAKPSQPRDEDSPKSNAWGTPAATAKINASSWNEGGEKEEKTGSWTSWGKKDNKADGTGQADGSLSLNDSVKGVQWGQKDSWNVAGESSSSWGKSVQKPDAPSWNTGVEVSTIENKTEGFDWSKKVEEKTDSQGGWGVPWGKKKDEVAGSSAPATDGDTEKAQEPGSWGWNKKTDQKPDQGGWKKKEGWGPKRDRPARPVGGPNDGPRSSGQFTATRQRLDMFTSDEQEIVAVIEPIMQSIRRIMHQTGYNDGDPLSADDQTYIIDNVFSHHPEKDQKMGTGIDHFMIAKHTQFQDSRCLFVVSTDGRKEDFSYRKCLESFVRVKYPDKAEEFLPKYFKKPQPRPPGNRDESGSPRSQPGWKRESNDESGTPRSQSGWKREPNGWNKESNVAGDEAATPVSGWNKESITASNEVGAPTNGWNKESTTASDEVGAPTNGWNQAGSSGGGSSSNKKSGWGDD
uniref:DNA-directed RNA polymerase V subunit 1 n=1 Tax=Erigeron canadensis TaxID=72917 RepID=UPI001CB90EF6|nr:DNA-directed RNA polymerase V subunit 1 [Erigeron canadensis]